MNYVLIINCKGSYIAVLLVYVMMNTDNKHRLTMPSLIVCSFGCGTIV